MLLVVSALVALKVHDTVDKLAVLGEGVRKVGGSVPLGLGDPVENLGRRGEDSVHRLANLLGLVTFALPALVVIWHFVPRRVAQIRRLNVAARAIGGAPERELAMRAAFSLPYGQLLAWTDDPLGDLAEGRYDRLVNAALEDAGLRRREAAVRPGI
ncbi:MAG: hypothetical protein QOH95_1241 [Gaiellaceae bacterium]|nr:hypothetical protein [Gaiellaceae bacterium]